MKRALISVSDKSGIFEFAKALTELGYEILSTGGTAKALREAGLPVTDVAAYTGSPEILDGRVKTLHPKIHGGLLGRRKDPRHAAEMASQGIAPIDLVAVNLYPFEAAINKPGCSFEEAIENIDIGGPSMLRSAAKNHADVTVVVDPADYPKVVDAMRGEGVSPQLRLDLARKVFQHTGRYDGMISGYLDAQSAGSAVKFPSQLNLQFEKVHTLRYGENPHQQGAFYRELSGHETAVARGRQLHGKEMSYNNFLDANSALELVKEFGAAREDAALSGSSRPVVAAAIVKHNNPCGAAIGDTPKDAYSRARDTDPISAFGGVVAFNVPVDLAAAKEMTATFLEVVVAPGFEDAALAELKRKKDLRVLDVGPLHTEGREGLDLLDMKKIVGGLILQDRDLGAIPDIGALKVVSKRPPTDQEKQAFAFGWKVCKHVKSNAIVFARPDRTIGIGAGQMSRVDSVKLATMKAASSLAGCIMASDAFFPFRDGIDAAAEAGITAVIQPGGSIRDQEVVQAADEHNMAMVLTGMRHFRH
ncbi:MAG TPA: bifunctional phosphoribosylaminoimidazolecarboxamide formyltransferase/IMP cyclohydrolase [Nitrospirales bacterium]